MKNKNENAVCVVSRTSKSGIAFMVYDRDRKPTIRTYLPDAVDGRWDGPLLTTATDILRFLADNEEEPCAVPLALAKELFNPQIPFADLPSFIESAADRV